MSLLLFALAFKVNTCGKTEIADLQLHVVIQKQIAQLQISVDDFVVVQILTSQNNLTHEITGFRLSDGLSSLVHFHERLFKQTVIKNKLGSLITILSFLNNTFTEVASKPFGV